MEEKAELTAWTEKKRGIVEYIIIKFQILKTIINSIWIFTYYGDILENNLTALSMKNCQNITEVRKTGKTAIIQIG